MRKLWSAFFCLCMLLVSLSVFAQQGEKSVGINVGYGTASSFDSFRLGAEFNWNATDHIRLSPSFDCYLDVYKRQDQDIGYGRLSSVSYSDRDWRYFR